MKAARRILVLLAVLVAGVLLMDYFTPARLQIDLKAPRFRLYRHRMIFPDQEFEMDWKHIADWSESALESPPIFGGRAQGGVYAWEVQGRVMMRFESLYDQVGGGTNDEWTRTNYGRYEINTGAFETDSDRPASEAKWLVCYPHQQSLSLSQQEINAVESAHSSFRKQIEAALEAARVSKQTNSGSRQK